MPKKKSFNKRENKMIDDLDYKALQDHWAKTLRQVKEDIKAGMKTEDLLKKYEVYAAGALISSMVDPRSTVAAAEKVLDRTMGKPLQKTESTHKLEKLSDQELDAFLKTQLKEDTDDDTVQ